VNLHPPTERQGADGPPQLIRPRQPALDEDHPDVRAADGDHQAGKAAAGAEIGHAQGIGRQERDKSLRVSNGLADRGRADRPAMAQAAQHLMEELRRGRHLQGR